MAKKKQKSFVWRIENVYGCKFCIGYGVLLIHLCVLRVAERLMNGPLCYRHNPLHLE